MVALRRLPDSWLLGLALFLVVGSEALIGLGLALTGGEPNALLALLITGGSVGGLLVAYPILPWLGVMLLGWCFGKRLVHVDRGALARRLASAGLVALGIFVIVRGLDGYGNMRLYREDASLVQWLHVSKYPPSLSYDALELGLMALCLAAFVSVERRGDLARILQPIGVLGQTALFFYLLHIHVLTLVAGALGVSHAEGLPATYGGALAVVVALYPVCGLYRRYKLAHPDGWARYV
jgi:uncharacterized membrane protein